MNLERVSNEEKLNLCRKYYLGGFAFLPFLWLVNIFWFFREAFLVPAYTEQSQIKGCESRVQRREASGWGEGEAGDLRGKGQWRIQNFGALGEKGRLV
uniref:Gamma-secretase subunit PEN-2 n=1 Tax=Mandrillus leucophaeus TaxID=9568 RepID=A0A2K5YGG2_MANLE